LQIVRCPKATSKDNRPTYSSWNKSRGISERE
jgi:hypothetical protein